MDKIEVTKLTASEIGVLWTTYMNDSLSICALKYFRQNAKDSDIIPILEHALSISQKHIQSIAQIFNKEGIPIPMGFTDADIDLEAPQLYSDVFSLRFLRHLGKVGMVGYAIAMDIAVRSDVRKFVYDCCQSSIDLNEEVVTTHLEKGLYIRPPYIPIPTKVEFVKSPSFFGSIIGKNRPLNAVELSHIFANIQTNAMGRVMLLGLAQTAQDPEVREYLMRGADISKKHIDALSTLFKQDDLSVPATWDSEITGSTVAPFSDKMAMQLTTILIVAGMTNYGTGLGSSTRVDVATDYGRIMMETAEFGEDGVQIMIKNGWLEQPPQAADRKELALSR